MSNLPTLPMRIVCACGQTHTCDIQRVLTGCGILEKVPALLEGLHEVTLVSDENTWGVAAQQLDTLLRNAGVRVTRAHFATAAVVVPDEESIAFVSAHTSCATQALVGVGSGVINDLCKYVSFQKNLPYMIVATAPSMDGFASKGAAMITRGMKVTYSARPPRWIVGDGDILQSAPEAMLQSGIGDIVGKLSCLNDWKLSHLINGEPFCPDICAMVEREISGCTEELEAVMARDKSAVLHLFESLVLVGIAMSLQGTSRPASGSEHHLSHFYEIVGLSRGLPYLAHGIDVAWGTVVTCRLREWLADTIAPTVHSVFDKVAWQSDIQRVYGDMAEEVIALQEKTGFYSTDRFETIRHCWPQLRALLQSAPTADTVLGYLRRAQLVPKQYPDTYDRELIAESILWAKDLKDRYTLLWLLQDLGLLEEYSHRLAEELPVLFG